jgi:hypothetical protein
VGVGPAVLAETIDLKGVSQRLETVLPAHLFLELLDLLLNELENRTAPFADEVLVVLASERSFVKRAAVTHGMTTKKTGLDQVGESPIDRGARDTHAVATERVDELFGVEMTEVADGVVEDRSSPGRHAKTTLP